MYRVWWTLDAASSPKMINIAIEANSTGWIGLGLSTDGSMGSGGLGSSSRQLGLFFKPIHMLTRIPCFRK
jgi:hypothetical protein